MRLQSNERSILAAFSDSKQAEQAAAELKESGVEAIRVDELRQEPGEPTDGLHELITGAGDRMARAGTSLSSRDVAVLKAADPDSSGMADGSQQEMSRPVLLTVVVDEKDFARAADIVRKHGGTF